MAAFFDPRRALRRKKGARRYVRFTCATPQAHWTSLVNSAAVPWRGVRTCLWPCQCGHCRCADRATCQTTGPRPEGRRAHFYGHSPSVARSDSPTSQCASLVPRPSGRGAMRRYSKGHEPVKARRHKTVTRKRLNARKAGRRPSVADTQQTELTRLSRERDEALEQQAGSVTFSA